MGGLPVASPLTLNGTRQSPGPAGYIPSQIQTAYGLSSNGGYNNNISFAGIKGDGAGQTIGIFEEGYNPAFVNSTDPNYATSALPGFDKTFGLPNPPSLTFVDHNGIPLSASNNAGNNSDFINYGAGVEIALRHRVGTRHGARREDRRPLRHAEATRAWRSSRGSRRWPGCRASRSSRAPTA